MTNTEQLLKCSCPQNHRRSEGLIQSSFSDALCKKSHVSSSKHGFVYAIYKAYSYHHHLVLRPEDVWVSILTQLNFYINKHAEELRSMFVSHEGQKELRVKEVGSIDTVDFGRLAVRMTEEIERNVLDPELRTWIMPSFTSTTDTDRVVAAILMMGTMQKYFSYVMDLLCGIPSVTLLGERDDWAQLVAKLDKIPQFGEEPAKFATLLKPVLTRFLESFDDPDSPELVTFWDKCAHYIAGGSGPDYISGWITAFCFWDEDGNCLYQNAKDYFAHFEGEDDHIKYHLIESEAIPAGHASVPVKVNDNGKEYDTTMVAGSVAIHAMPRGFMLNATYGTANATHERSQTSKADESIRYALNLLC